ncbi:MAG: hypothetical protein L0211_08625 [Planctomycetaceae bacterium]|nr:hypothetical protein [Planctomycetaceae bacterium]
MEREKQGDRMNARYFPAAILLLFASTASGCFGPSGPVTYPVEGQVELSGGKVQNLSGHTIEAALVTDANVRAYGQIASDGSFALETLQGGDIRSGAVEGKYQARIVLSDDDDSSRAKAAEALNHRFLQFETSGLTFDVPASDDVVLSLSSR